MNHSFGEYGVSVEEFNDGKWIFRAITPALSKDKYAVLSFAKLCTQIQLPPERFIDAVSEFMWEMRKMECGV